MESLEYVQGATDKLRLALKQLPDRTRRVYLLHRLENLPHAEVAARLGLSPRTVERDVVEAITHLKRALFPSERS
jgi:RNA polymerase sigma-70 factor (ECF subfamily)